MVFFNDMNRVGPLPRITKEMPQMLVPSGSAVFTPRQPWRQSTSLRKYDKRRWRRPVQPSTPKPRGLPQNPRAFCGDGVGIAWRRRRKSPLDRHSSVLVRRYGLSLTLSALFSASLGPLCTVSRTASLQQRLQSWSAASSTVDIDVLKRPETISIDQGRVYPGPWRRAQRSCSDGMMTLSMLLESIRMYVPRPSCYTEPTLLLLLLPHHSR